MDIIAKINSVLNEEKKMKYKLGESKVIDGVKMYRVIALKDIPRHGVKAGDVGGWIESEKNLSQDGDAWVSENAKVSENARVSGDAWVGGDDAWIGGNAQVFGDAKVSENARVYREAMVYGNSRVFGDAQVGGEAQVSGEAEVSGIAWVFGNAQVSGDARVDGNAEVSENEKNKNEDATLSGNVASYPERIGTTQKRKQFENDKY